MNTVLKGNLFEDKAYDIIMAALNEGQIGFIPGICQPFRQKAYYASDRKDFVKFDMSIEVRPEGAERYSNICFIECKDYGKGGVPVGEVIKFVGDITSVAGKHAKAILITTSKLQKAAKSYAEHHGLMVIHVDTKGQHNIILHNTKRTKNHQQIDQPVREFSEKLDLLADINAYYEQGHSECVEIQEWDKMLYDCLNKLLNNQTQWRQPDNQVEGAQRRSGKLIEQIAINIIDAFDSNILYSYRALPMEKFIVYFTQKFGVKIVIDKAIPVIKEKTINGYIDFDKKIIYIDNSLVDTPQFNFVLAHEMGHFFLHSDYSADQLSYDNLKDSEYNKVLGKHALINAKHWIEWQANHFAACLLMPYKTILAQTLLYQIRNGINGHRGTIYVDYQLCNQQAYDALKQQFTSYFCVSNATLEYRLSDLGILKFGPGGNYRRTNPNFERNARTIGQILSKMVYSFEQTA